MLLTSRPRSSTRHPRLQRPLPTRDRRWGRRPRSAGMSRDRRRCGRIVTWGLLGVAALLSLFAPRLAGAQVAAAAAPMSPQVAYSRLPLVFEANHGQTASSVKFVAHSQEYTLWLTPTEAVLTFARRVRSTPQLMATDQPGRRQRNVQNPS